MKHLWMYKQGGPGVFKGDLYFYRVDGDLAVEQSKHRYHGLSALSFDRRIRFFVHARKTPGGQRGKFPAREVTVMKELGHFPMSENPEAISPLYPSGA